MKHGLTNHNIINHSFKSELPIQNVASRYESVSKVFDHKRATFHNYQPLHREQLKKRLFLKKDGEFTKYQSEKNKQ